MDELVGLDRGLIIGLGALAFVFASIYSRQYSSVAPSVLALLLLSDLLVFRRWRVGFAPVAVAVVAVFCIWVWLSLTWTIAPDLTLRAALSGSIILGSTLLLAGMVALSPDERRRLQGYLVLAAFLYLALMTFERATGLAGAKILMRLFAQRPPEWLPWLNPAAAALAVAIWLSIAGALGRGWRVPAFLIWVWTALLLNFLESGSAILGFAAASVMFGIGLLAPRFAALAVQASVPLAMILFPLIAAYALASPAITDRIAALPLSQQHRFIVLSFAAERFRDRPAFGWGANASRRIPGGGEKVSIVEPQADGSKRVFTARKMPMHPHNSALQLLLELGIAGGVLFSAVWIVVVRRMLCRAPPGPVRAAVGASLAGIVAVACLSHGFWDFNLLGAYGCFVAIGFALLNRAHAGNGEAA